ncbi:MAG TPA: SgcJ/EcaC family oxidoreductase [Chthoniobacterales bacterium]
MSTSAYAINAPDQEEIRVVVMGFFAAWNRHDMKAFAELFADDADWINTVGMHWRGKAAVVKAHEVFHRTIFQHTEMTPAATEIRAVTSDVAVAVVTVKAGDFTTPEGERKTGTQDRLSLILVKREGGWRLTHGHNTVIDPKAQPFDPVDSGWTD